MLADVVLLLHAAIVLFNGGGVLAIAVGGALGWAWVRHRVFRVAHLGALGFVAVEALLGVTCPLTTLEGWLRGEALASGFVAGWISRWLYWDWPAWVFVALYSGVFFAAAVLWIGVPPRARKN